jgi:hypothetical protein
MGHHWSTTVEAKGRQLAWATAHYTVVLKMQSKMHNNFCGMFHSYHHTLGYKYRAVTNIVK